MSPTSFHRCPHGQQTVQLTPIDFIGNFIRYYRRGVIYNQHSRSRSTSASLVTFGIIPGLKLPDVEARVDPASRDGKGRTDHHRGGRFTCDALDSSDHKLDLPSFSQSYAAWASFINSLAQREAIGSLTVRRGERRRREYLLCRNGQIVSENMELAGRSEEWLVMSSSRRVWVPRESVPG